MHFDSYGRDRLLHGNSIDLIQRTIRPGVHAEYQRLEITTTFKIFIDLGEILPRS
jgi:hypothetical protein